MASNVIAFFFIEDKRIGRRPLLLFGIITMTLCMLGIAITAEVTNGVYTHAGGVLLTLFVALFATANVSVACPARAPRLRAISPSDPASLATPTSASPARPDSAPRRPRSGSSELLPSA
jgi:hypothetical protein